VAASSRWRRLLASILYPFLFGAFPVLSLLAHNIMEVPANDAGRALVIVLLATGGLLLVVGAWFRDLDRTALLVTMIWILFFSYGHLYQVLRDLPGLG
jgi:hypothetical protein